MQSVADHSMPTSKILLVDDQPQNLYALELTLKALPATVISATSGAEALALTLKHDFAIAILDVQMPEMDGYELAELLLGDPTTCRIPVLFVTAAYADELHRFKGYDAGAVDYMVKPVVPSVLLSKVRVFLELARYRENLERLVDERTCALRESEQNFADLFQYAPQAMIMVDADRRIVKTNSNAEALFGYSHEAFEQLHLCDLTSESNDTTLSDLLEAGAFEPTAPGTHTVSKTISARRSDGSAFRASVGLAVLSRNDGPFVVIGVDDVSDALTAHEAVQTSLHEKELLLREIHHRVNNNLQIVSSLLALQTDKSAHPDLREVLTKSAGRVRSMALIHRELYSATSLARIDFGSYTRTLTEILHNGLDNQAKVSIRVTQVDLGLDKASPCALILNELMTNALKHGRSPNGCCNIVVEVSSEGGNLLLVVSDNGPGLPEGFDQNATTSLGMSLISSLTQQVRGSITLANQTGRGLRCQLIVPLEHAEDARTGPQGTTTGALST